MTDFEQPQIPFSKCFFTSTFPIRWTSQNQRGTALKPSRVLVSAAVLNISVLWWPTWEEKSKGGIYVYIRLIHFSVSKNYHNIGKQLYTSIKINLKKRKKFQFYHPALIGKWCYLNLLFEWPFYNRQLHNLPVFLLSSTPPYPNTHFFPSGFYNLSLSQKVVFFFFNISFA